jgi:nitrate/nitrite transport system substrate-binding protein
VTASTLLAHGCSLGNSATVSPSRLTVHVNAADAPEVNAARLGYIPLTDAAPLIIAKEKGFFEQYGMVNVEIVKHSSWDDVQSNLAWGHQAGGTNGAHLLSPMPYLMYSGKTSLRERIPLYILARLNVNGQGISLANIYQDLDVRLQSSRLKEDVDKAKAIGPGIHLKMGVTFPGGTHDLWMRYWLASGNIHPDTDVAMFTVPPLQMVANLKTGTMNAFCVGEPWNAQLLRKNIGYSALTTGELWQDHPEKAFAMRMDWVDRYPKATKAILRAIQQAQRWCDELENKAEMCRIIAAPQYLNVSVDDILERAKGNFLLGNNHQFENSPYRMKFWANYASYPYKSHDIWFLTENIRWGYLPADTDMIALVNAINREDLWREAAKAISQASVIPKSTSRGIETFFDSRQFDADNPTTYLNSLPIKKLQE